MPSSSHRSWRRQRPGPGWAGASDRRRDARPARSRPLALCWRRNTEACPINSIASPTQARRYNPSRKPPLVVLGDPPCPYARARILQRTGRICVGRQGICNDTGPWPVDAGALDQRHRQFDLRLPDLDRRRRLHLVRQQSRKPAHLVVQRSRQRSPGRGFLSAGRKNRRCLEPHSASHPRRLGDLCRPSRPGL